MTFDGGADFGGEPADGDELCGEMFDAVVADELRDEFAFDGV